MVLARPCNIIVYEILLNYLQLDLLVVPAQIDESLWMVLFELAEYYCLGRLMAICENMLISKVTDCNCEEIMLFAL